MAVEEGDGSWGPGGMVQKEILNSVNASSLKRQGRQFG